MGTMRRAGVAIAAAVGVGLAIALAGCGLRYESESTGSQPIHEVRLTAPSTLEVTSPSCNGDPSVDVEEAEDAVVLDLQATVRNPGDACLDVVVVELDAPLGDRSVIDRATDAELDVLDR
ncbi:hypothetical protein [Demequina sp.]|uniref:hypothetical protein n=1 Tax=Demequina sp. TaxID=2050685 RepID=UPI0025DE06B8|nr:hypothetical protein [Demequina sp.]